MESPPDRLRVAALQFDVRRGALEANLARVERGLDEALDLGVDLLALPELWATGFEVAGGPFGSDEACERALEANARAHGRLLERTASSPIAVAGSHLAPGPQSRAPFNRFSVVANGEELVAFDKLHLFTPTGEPLAFSAGRRAPGVAPWRGLKIGGLVCYDLRFGPACEALFASAPELIVVPAQWPSPRAVTWRALIAGRAAEAQAVVIGANRTGADSTGERREPIRFGGDSLVAGPDGEVLADAPGREGLVVAELDLAALRRLRRRVPVRRDRRPAIYGSWGQAGGQVPEEG